jgi:L-fuculose-phosphate aldolase
MEEQLRREIIASSHAVHAAGWVANHDGNLTARLEDGSLLATPTAVSKGDVEPEWLIVVNDQMKVLRGTRKPFSELQLHLAAYRARPDIGVVIHAHPPAATAFAVSGADLGHPFMAEPVVSLGPEIPVVPFSMPKDPQLDQDIAVALATADVCILAQHGVLAVGGSFEQAFLRLELLEHLARIAQAAQAHGGTRRLDSARVAKLAAKGRPKSVPDFSELAPVGGQAPRPKVVHGHVAGRPNVGALVADALRRLD